MMGLDQAESAIRDRLADIQILDLWPSQCKKRTATPSGLEVDCDGVVATSKHGSTSRSRTGHIVGGDHLQDSRQGLTRRHHGPRRRRFEPEVRVDRSVRSLGGFGGIGQ